MPGSETYRGPAPASEPETKAMQGLLDRIRFKFQANLHSFGRWLLYPRGLADRDAGRGRPDLPALAGNLIQPGDPASIRACRPTCST